MAMEWDILFWGMLNRCSPRLFQPKAARNRNQYKEDTIVRRTTPALTAARIASYVRSLREKERAAQTI